MVWNYSRLKPQVSCSVHLLVAAWLWTVVGLVLMSRGIAWLNAIDQLWIVLPSLLIGSMKSFFMLDKSARTSIKRILSTREGKFLGSVYSVKTWLLIILMAAAGCLIRHSSLPKEFLGLFYVSIGWGLFLSSRHSWMAWKHSNGNSLKKTKHK